MRDENVPDLSRVSPQSSFIESRPEKPSATSTIYLRRFATKTGDGADHHVVVGAHVVLAKGQPNGLWEALHVDRATQKIDANNPRVATRTLEICCDTLEVHGELSLPEANVDVFARRLVWADDTARINTSPLGWTTEKARNASGDTPGQDGAQGRTAGSLRVFACEVSPSDDAHARLIAHGGRGQDPGAGQDGTDGDRMFAYPSYPFSITDSGMSTSRKTVPFDFPAVYIDYEWRWAASRVWGPGYLGENRWPKDGTNALAPGVPGSGGDGGTLTTNIPALARSLQNAGGGAGKQERNYRGGSAGQPQSCAKYKVRLWENIFGTNNASFDCHATDKHTSKAGTEATSRPAARAVGNTPAPVIVATANAWLHPLAIQVALEYARDLFLAGARDEVLGLLSAYHDALRQPEPDTGAWTGVPASQWTGAQTEVATMIQRLSAHLDYFGNPAGYTPLLSLPGSIKLYENETRRALRMMLLTSWITDVDREAREAAGLMTEAVDAANADSQAAAEQVAVGERKIGEVKSLIDTLTRDLTGLGNRLVALRNGLLVKAENDLRRQAAIKGSIKMAGALCQVIPVGQPALGTIGSLGAVSADFIGGDPDSVPDTLSKMSDVLKEASKAAQETEKAAEEARKGKDAPAAKDTAEAVKKSSAWGQVGKGLAPSLSLAAQSVAALQVPRSEVDAALARLAADDPAWNELTRDISELNEKKATLFGALAEAIQSVGEGVSRLAANAGAVVRFQQQRDRALGKVDAEAVFAVRDLGQRSRLTLQKYLYLLVKSFESALLRPLDVDWKLTALTEKISALLKPGGRIDANWLDSQAKALDELFQQNLSTLRAQLLKEFDFGENTTPLKLGLTARQTPEVIATLNERGQVVISPETYGLSLPTEHLARLSGVTLTKVVFDPAGPSLPDTTNAVFSLVPARTGIVRRAEGLYALASDSPVRWSWTYLSASDIRAAKPSESAKDVLDFVLGSGSETIRRRVSIPPVWSDLTLSLMFTPPLAKDRRPRVAELYFEASVDSSPAPRLQRVLSIRPTGCPPGAVIACSPDLAGRGDGLDGMIRIYTTGETVELSAPAHVSGAVFEGWEIIGAGVESPSPGSHSARVKLDDHTVALCQWARAGEHAGVRVDLAALLGAEAFADAVRREPGGEKIRATLAARARAPRPVALPTARAIRIEPAPTSTIVGVVPPGGIPEVLEHGPGVWRLVNHRGVVGWMEAVDEPAGGAV